MLDYVQEKTHRNMLIAWILALVFYLITKVLETPLGPTGAIITNVAIIPVFLLSFSLAVYYLFSIIMRSKEIIDPGHQIMIHLFLLIHLFVTFFYGLQWRAVSVTANLSQPLEFAGYFLFHIVLFSNGYYWLRMIGFIKYGTKKTVKTVV